MIDCNNTSIQIVDFGGDILTDKDQSSIISPELDAYTLAVVKNLSEYSSKLIVCFPGVDGELHEDYLLEYCKNNSISSIEVNTSVWLEALTLIDGILFLI